MKTIGMLGGMSWESSIVYYRLVNEIVRERLGGLHSAKSVMVSVDFGEMEALQRAGAWDEATTRMIAAARQVEAAGGDFLVICSNTMHRMADEVAAAIDIPLLHIADATARPIVEQDAGPVGLLGTRFTMEDDFYRGRLEKRHGLDVLVPSENEREYVHRVIYDELVLGIERPESEMGYWDVIANLAARGAESIILGCTEIGSLINQQHTTLPLFDTTLLHTTAAVELALEQYEL